MTAIRARCFPPVPGTHAFPEINVRTYVTVNDRPGVWFLSLDATHALAVWLARRTFFLPYYRARIRAMRRGTETEYTSARYSTVSGEDRDFGTRTPVFRARYGPIGAAYRAKVGSIDAWLTDRFCRNCLAC